MGWVTKGECNDGAKQRRKVKGFVIASVGEFKRESKKSVHEHHE